MGADTMRQEELFTEIPTAIVLGISLKFLRVDKDYSQAGEPQQLAIVWSRGKVRAVGIQRKGTRVCRDCGEEKDINEFARNGMYRRHSCKACALKVWINEHKDRRREPEDRDVVDASMTGWLCRRW